MDIFSRITLKPLFQLIITFIIFAVLYLGLTFLVNYLEIPDLLPRNYIYALNQVIITVAVLTAVLVAAVFIEKKKLSETGIKKENFFKYLFTGFIIGGILISSIIISFHLCGWYKVTSVSEMNTVPGLAFILLVTFVNVTFQEIFSRALIFRKLEESFGTWPALLLDIVFFGIVHMSNSNTSFREAMLVGIIGTPFTLSYILSRNIWLPVGIHTGWNYLQSNIWGVHLSGSEKETSLFNSVVNGPDFYTGGDFGPEGGFIAITVCLLFSIYLLFRINRNKETVNIKEGFVDQTISFPDD